MRYYIDGEDMTIYVDLVFFLNFFFEYNSDTYMDTAKAKLYSSYAIQHQHQY